MERWVKKTAVVTGASAGIGAAICVGLANAGLTVVGLARRPELIDKLAESVTGTGSIHSKKCDVRVVNEIQECFKWVEDNFGGVDVLVNNAGVLFPGSITAIGDKTLSDEDILSIIDINVKGLVICARQAIASMKKRNFVGHIININSVAGHYVPLGPDFNVYPSSKYAVTAFTTSLLTELANAGSKIRVTSLSPGLVNTGMAEHRNVEQGAMLQSSDIADAIIYVLSTPPHVNITELTIMSAGEKKI